MPRRRARVGREKVLATAIGERFPVLVGPRPYLAAEQERLDALTWTYITVRQLSPTIGAEITGVDLGRELSDELVGELHQALLEYKVLFFRDQDITSEDHLRFARHFGELEVHPFLPPAADSAQLVSFAKDREVAGNENLWHSDVSWRIRPSLASVLRARAVPKIGGDTLFSDMYAAYECLDEATKDRIADLQAIHDFTHSFGRSMDADTLHARQQEFPAAEHPVVRTHPETGRKLLYVNRIFTSHIVGMDPDESIQLLEELCRNATYPEYQCRFHWEPNSIAFWDNRAVQHYAVNDYWPQRRVMERATIIGDRPF